MENASFRARARRSAPSPSAFEVADGAGDVSEHSDASHDRTAGVRGFNFQELKGDAYGRGRRRRDGGDANRIARRIAARRRGGGGGALEVSSDSDSDSDSDLDDGSPLEGVDATVDGRELDGGDAGHAASDDAPRARASSPRNADSDVADDADDLAPRRRRRRSNAIRERVLIRGTRAREHA